MCRIGAGWSRVAMRGPGIRPHGCSGRAGAANGRRSSCAWQRNSLRVSAQTDAAAAPLVPVSIGELVDRLTILEIKAERIADPGKTANIRKELALLAGAHGWPMTPPDEAERLKHELRRVNELLWEIEDLIRACERAGDFGPDFVALARSFYKTNAGAPSSGGSTRCPAPRSSRRNCIRNIRRRLAARRSAPRSGEPGIHYPAPAGVWIPGSGLRRPRNAAFSASLLPVPDHDHLHHPAAHIGVRHRRALDEQPVALEADEARSARRRPRPRSRRSRPW